MSKRSRVVLDARTKVIVAIMALSVIVSTPPGRFGAFACYLILSTLAVVASRVSLKTLKMRWLALAPFVLMTVAFVPFLNTGHGMHVVRSGWLIAWNVAIKAALGVLCITWLTETTPFPALLSALEQFRVPKTAVLLLGFTHRYLYVLREEAMRMRRALVSRGYRARWLWHATVLGRVIGMLFIRTYDRAERVYLAMKSRGFDGDFQVSQRTQFEARDWAFATVCATILLMIRLGAP